MSRKKGTSWGPPRRITQIHRIPEPREGGAPRGKPRFPFGGSSCRLRRRLRSRLCGSQHEAWLLQELLERLKEPGGRGAVNGTVAERRGEGRHGPDGRLTVDRDDPVLDRAHGDDRRLRRVEDGGEALDAEHAQIRDRERAPIEVVLPELPVARTRHDVLAGRGNLGQRQPLDTVDDGDDEAL